MRPVFSNISFFYALNLLLSTYHSNLFGGVLRPLKIWKFKNSKIYYYRLKFCEMMPQKSSFQTVLMIKGFGIVVKM